MSTDFPRDIYGIEGNGIKDSMHLTNSTILRHLTVADFSILILELTTYFALLAANNFFGCGLTQNQLLLLIIKNE